MTSDAETQLGLTRSYDPDLYTDRQQRLQGATERLNTIAGNVRKITADIDWRGEAADRARGAFTALAAKLNEHADAINGLRLADQATAAPITQARQDHEALQGLTPENALYVEPMLGPGETIAQFRQRCAERDHTTLRDAIHTAQSSLRSVVSWDLDTPAPAGPPAGPSAGHGDGGGLGGDGQGHGQGGGGPDGRHDGRDVQWRDDGGWHGADTPVHGDATVAGSPATWSREPVTAVATDGADVSTTPPTAADGGARVDVLANLVQRLGGPAAR